MNDAQELSLTLTQESDYVFRIAFDETGIPDLYTDEPPPMGKDSGPNPSRLLLAAVANCLTASLLFALRKFKNTPEGLTAHARATLSRNAEGHWRVAHIAVNLELANTAATLQHLDRVLAQFEDFCVVTESVRQGITVDVNVYDANGQIVHPLAE
jgi:organic hydroperoxide reductase OsmC/OhrA